MTPARADDYGRKPEQRVRRRAADADRQLQRLRQWRYQRKPEHGTDPGSRSRDRAPATWAAYTDHRQRRSAVDTDYTISYVGGTLTRNAGKRLTITADNQSAVYGAVLPTLTASYSGFVNGDTGTSLTTAPTLATSATAASHVGSYTVTASGCSVDADYTISYVAGDADRDAGKR